MRNKAQPVKVMCFVCEKEDGGPWSAAALLGARKFVHTRCERKFNSQASARAIDILNNAFAKMVAKDRK